MNPIDLNRFNPRLDVPGEAWAPLTVINIEGALQYFPEATLTDAMFNNGAVAMIEDVLMHLDAENMLAMVSHNLAWTADERAQWLSDPAHQPYRSHIVLSDNPAVRMQQFVYLGNWLRSHYQTLKSAGDPQAQHVGQLLAQWVENTTQNLFGQLYREWQDKLNNVAGRDEDMIYVNPWAARAMRATAEEVLGEGFHPHYEQASAVTLGGWHPLVGSFLLNHRGTPEVREILQAVVEKRTHDRVLTVEKIRIGWAVHRYLMTMGVTIELMLEVVGLPPIQIVRDRLFSFLQATGHEMWKHVQAEAPGADNDPVDVWEMLALRAVWHNLPDHPLSPQQLEEKWRRARVFIESYLTQAFTENQLSHVFVPTRVGSHLRDSNITYPNTRGNLVNVVVLNVRREEVNFLGTAAHEAGHQIHSHVLMAAEAHGQAEQNAWDRVPPHLKEAFALLIQKAMEGLYQLEIQQTAGSGVKSHEGGRFSNLFQAYGLRRQGPLALGQLYIREVFEHLYQTGHTEWLLEEFQVHLISGQLDKMAKEWYSEGLEMVHPGESAMTNFDPINHLDGLVYLGRDIVGAPPSSGSTPSPEEALTLEGELVRRFGEDWLSQRDGRIILMWLMSLSAQHTSEATLAEMVDDADVDMAAYHLELCGFDATTL